MDIFLLIFEELIKDVPRTGHGDFATSDTDTVQKLIAAICLGLTNRENWKFLRIVTCVTPTSSIWLCIRGHGKENHARCHLFKSSLVSCLESWMLPKYRVAWGTQCENPVRELEGFSFQISKHCHSNALFLSREIYGDGPEWEMGELELIERYADRKTIIHKAHTLNRDIRAVRRSKPQNIL